jgi:hypothetical protein
MPRKTKDPIKIQNARKRVRNSKGVFLSDQGDTKYERWNIPGPYGFAYWFRDTQPQILNAKGVYRKIKLTRKQADIIKAVYAVNKKGEYKHSLCLNLQPRRHGKSVTFALIVLHHFFSRKNWTAQLCGNTEAHSRRVQFNLIWKILMNTPKLREMIKDKDLTQHEIKNSKRGNVIQAMLGVNTAAAFGDRLNLVWQSDMHASIDPAFWNALQASLLDSEGSLCLIDSNVDSLEGPVHQLQTEAENDKGIFCDHVFYRDLDHYCKEAPEWINRQKARRLERVLLPAEFKRDI